jgi:hypothetical protein
VEAIYRETPRSKGVANQARKPLCQSDWVGWPRPFLGRFGPVFLPAAHLHILDLAPLIFVILSRHPHDQDRGSFRMKYELYVLVLGDNPSYHLGPCHCRCFRLATYQGEYPR